jgi:DNA-binding NarL/FixJ family response regulator
MPPKHTDEGIQFATELRTTHPEIGVVVLSQYSDPSYAIALLDDGSDGRAYLLKERIHNRAELTGAIRSVAAGGSVVDSSVVVALVHARSQSDHSPLKELTVREREVLSEIAQGKSNMAIAESLFLTKRAVEKHINTGPLWRSSSLSVGQLAGGNQAGCAAWRAPAHPPSPSGFPSFLLS